MDVLKKTIWRALKETPSSNCQTLQQLAEKTKIDVVALQGALDDLVAQKFLEKRGDRYCVSIVLLPLKPDKTRRRHIDYKFTPMTLPTGALREETVAEPIDPSTLAPEDQDEIGSCVGKGTGQAASALYLQLTKDFPTDQDKAEYKFNVIDDDGMRHDHMWRQTFSSWWAYVTGREEGAVWESEGSYPSFSVRAWMKRGICFDNQFECPKNSAFASRGIPADLLPQLEAAAAEHKIDGYAQTGDTFDQLKAAINQKGFAIIGLTVYDNYTSMIGGDGTFPEPPENPDRHIAGGHCMFAYKKVGCDNDDWIYVLHSWDGKVGREGKFSRNYANVGLIGGENYVVLDANDVVRIKRAYVTSKITSNVPANISVDGAFVGNTSGEVKATLEIGKSYRVFAEPADNKYYSQGKSIIPTETTTEINFQLGTEPEPNPDDGNEGIWALIMAIIEWLKEIFGRVKKKIFGK